MLKALITRYYVWKISIFLDIAAQCQPLVLEYFATCIRNVDEHRTGIAAIFEALNNLDTNIRSMAPH